MTRTSWITGICLGTLVAAALVFPGFPDKTAAHEMHGHESGLSMQQLSPDIQIEVYRG